ncbi:MAG: hypothetical protein JWR89_4591 [Tardiphaga sp.]|nr:hypothetical protein [Tardiphaga sp.]
MIWLTLIAVALSLAALFVILYLRRLDVLTGPWIARE